MAMEYWIHWADLPVFAKQQVTQLQATPATSHNIGFSGIPQKNPNMILARIMENHLTETTNFHWILYLH